MWLKMKFNCFDCLFFYYVGCVKYEIEIDSLLFVCYAID